VKRYNEMDARERILQTAMSVVNHQGINKLTIDNVAAEAGMSKGGVFYHFKNKEELLKAMVHSIIEAFKTDCKSKESTGLDAVQASIESAFSDEPEMRNRVSALVAAVAYDKNITTEFKEGYEEWIQDLQAAGASRATARLICTTIDGYYIASALGVGNLSAEERLMLKERLMIAARPTETEMLYHLFKKALAAEEAKESQSV
jgi:AcrR family transcriptional regulator